MGSFDPLKINHYLIVEVSGKRFAFDIKEIESIHTSKNAISNDGIEDMKAAVRLHKKVIPIINLREKFYLRTEAEQSYYPSLVFLKNKGKSEISVIGVQVDMIVEIAEVNQMQIKKHEYGFPAIQVFSSLKYESVPLIRVHDIVKEHESTLIESEVLN